jgi:hypothetical protein
MGVHGISWVSRVRPAYQPDIAANTESHSQSPPTNQMGVQRIGCLLMGSTREHMRYQFYRGPINHALRAETRRISIALTTTPTNAQSSRTSVLENRVVK